MERRDFINSLSQASMLMGIAGLAAACSKSSGTPAGGNTGGTTTLVTADLSSELTAVGSFKIGHGAILIRTGPDNTADNFSALSLTCTHQGCTIAYDQNNEQFKCPCHGSEFNASGAVLQGPASAPLAKFKITIIGNSISIS